MGFNVEFRDRTKKFALRIIKLYQSLPKTEESRIIGKQLLRSGTSIGANYRSATKGRSERNFFLSFQSQTKKQMKRVTGLNY